MLVAFQKKASNALLFVIFSEIKFSLFPISSPANRRSLDEILTIDNKEFDEITEEYLSFLVDNELGFYFIIRIDHFQNSLPF